MNIHSLKYTYTLLAAALCLSASAIAQDKKTEPQEPAPTGALTEEIEVVRPYKPVLADAVKIRRNPDMTTDKTFKPVLSYTIIDKKLDLNSNIKELQAQKMADEQASVLSNNYVKIGAGNFNTALGEVYMNTGRDEALQAGAFFKHLSQQGNLIKQQFSNQEIGAFGKSIGANSTISGKLTYDRKSTFFYGQNTFSPANPDENPDKQRFSTISAEAELISNYSEKSLLDYAASLNIYRLSNIFDASEGSVLLGGHINKAVSNFNFGANASVDFTSTKDLAYKIGNNILRANPYVKFQSNGFTLNIGANIVQEFGETGRLNIFPAVSAEFPLAASYAILFAGLNGDILKTSLKDLASDNPYLNQNLSIRNSVEKMNLYAGLKGNAGSELGYKVMAFYKTVEDMQLFVNNLQQFKRFDVVYDNGTSNIFGLDGEISVKASGILNITGKAQIFNYEMASEKEAWFKPSFRLISNARAQMNQKLFLDAELLFQGSTYGRVNSPVDGFDRYQLEGFLDLGAGAEYRVNNKIGVYLRANNLLGQYYQQYLHYPKLGLNVFGGLNYSF